MPTPRAIASTPSKSGSNPDNLRRGLLVAAALAALFLAGCAGYQLGPTNARVAGAQSIQVNPIANKTLEPRLTAAVTASLRKSLQQDGTFRLHTGNDGDIIVDGTIEEFDRSHLSLRPDDIITPRDYRVSLIAHIRAVERASGRVLVDRRVRGRTTLRVGADLSAAERQAIPLMADDLARRATSLLVDGDW